MVFFYNILVYYQLIIIPDLQRAYHLPEFYIKQFLPGIGINSEEIFVIDSLF
jgi:hypothetical protein